MILVSFLLQLRNIAVHLTVSLSPELLLPELSRNKQSVPGPTAKSPTPLDNVDEYDPANDPPKQVESTDTMEAEQEVEKLLRHRRLSDGKIELLVKWADESEKATFEPEEEIQNGAADTLYEYWGMQGGRTQTLFRAGDCPPECYHVFKILRHEKHKKRFVFEVQWVGYPATRANTTMEAESKLKSICPDILHKYWESKGGRSKHLAKRGRPRTNRRW